MDVGIVGLPRSGKTTVFNSVTRGSAQVADFSGQSKPNLGVAKVPDPRLNTLTEIHRPKRVVAAEVRYADLPAPPEGFGKSRGISGEYLGHLQRTDVLMIVVRAFTDPSVSHVDDSIDPHRDAETLLLELTFADLEILEKRLARLADGLKSAKTAERDAMNKERALLERLKERLEDGTAIRNQDLAPEEAKALTGYRFLTSKPVIVALNVGEDQLAEAGDMEAEFSGELASSGASAVVICGMLEMELAQMAPDDERAFRDGMAVGEAGLDRMVGLSYRVGDLITFFTGDEKEVRAWAVVRGTEALRAAGRIHSDIERGFIRAEVVSFEDFPRSGSLADARKRGVLRMEGKTYVIRDGDVINILFNV